ncbi:MAG: hypothetical protein LBS70_07205 [Candidatus Accumulibacter sp.]|nr:hypothetical protein [Accumulibacter sp.]
MKLTRWTAVAVLCLAAFQAGAARAATYADDIVNFPWLEPKGSSWNEDTYLRHPDIVLTEVIWNAVGVLEKIILTAAPDTRFLFPGSLFINTDYQGSLDVTDAANFAALQQWDWYVQKDDYGLTTAHKDSAYVGADGELVSIPGNGLYQVVNPLDYTYENGRSYNGRDGHINGLAASALAPNAVEGSQDMGTASGRYGDYWAGLAPDNTFVYDFTQLNVSISLGEQFAIAYSPYCANDVVLFAGSTGHTLDDPDSGFGVPEPGALSLYGIGLLGLAGCRLRSKKTMRT